jgi:hypothetical protein
MSSQAPTTEAPTYTDLLAYVDALRDALGTSFYDGGEWTQGVLVADEYEFQKGEWKIQIRLQVGDPNSNPPKPFFTVKNAQIEADGLHLQVEVTPGYQGGGPHPGWTRQPPGGLDYYTTIPLTGLFNAMTAPPEPPTGAYQELVVWQAQRPSDSS